MPGATGTLVDHFFRHEYGRLVAVLTRSLGLKRLDLVEDAVQSALTQAMQTWPRRGIPDDPAAWLFRVAKHAALDALRREQTWDRIRDALRPGADYEPAERPPEDQVGDELLRLLVACCHDALPVESQVALALKAVCGFSVGEIARALLTTQANVQKRLTRAKEKLREVEFEPAALVPDQLASRLDAVLTILYLIFNEGYAATSSDDLIRQDLCQEAARLTLLLAEHTEAAAAQALFALMCFQAARFDARLSAGGDLVLLADQDRSRWDRTLIEQGWSWLRVAARGDVLTRYHLEAALAAEHGLAPTFAATNWQRIVGLYDQLLRLEPSPLHVLNRAIAIAYLHGPQAALACMEPWTPRGGPKGYPYWPATLGELHRRLGHFEQARHYLEQALELTQSLPERHLLEQRLRWCAAGLAHVEAEPA
ncbi:MAG TPA: sigma-70 family RNA polymerase sigma factor [Gemmatales bacterium]|nr:sigma-70 family RNA polymerase sigma factor [Gemmatales bacterium]HMP58781.1 sigma-70 family RNA polymerase sigma factor [Gemmatales bacterium]